MQPLLKIHRALEQSRRLDFLAPLALRFYLAPVFWVAGTSKITNIEATIAWFGNPDWGLDLPFPALMAWLAALSESGGAIALVLGLAVRWISIPLMVTMAMAAFTVHWENGWLAIAESGTEASQRLSGLLEWLAAEYPGRHAFVTELGKPIMLNNGIEFAATYFTMLLTLFFIGGGRFLSVDYWLLRRLRASSDPSDIAPDRFGCRYGAASDIQ